MWIARPWKEKYAIALALNVMQEMMVIVLFMQRIVLVLTLMTVAQAGCGIKCVISFAESGGLIKM